MNIEEKKSYHGPTEDRGCTDIICCLLFILYFIAMFSLGIYGFVKGSPSRLIVPYDSNGKACGLDAPLQDYPYIYFANPIPGHLNFTLCLSKCPNDNYTQAERDTLYCKAYGNRTDCTGIRIDIKNTSFKSLMDFENNHSISNDSVLIYPTIPVFKRLCMPDASLLVKKFITLNNSAISDKFSNSMNDLIASWEVYLIILFGSFIIGFIYLYLMKWCGKCILWISIFTFIAALIILGIFFWQKAIDIEKSDQYLLEKENLEDSSSNLKNAVTAYKAGAIVSWVASAFIILIIFCLCERINLALGILEACTEFISDVPCIIFLPMIINICLLILWVFIIAGFVCIGSVGKIYATGQTPFASVQWEKSTRYGLLFFLFGSLWNTAFVSALMTFILASTVALWYFKRPNLESPILVSVGRAFKYHIGSLAFGSMILAIIQLIRWIFTYMQTQVKKSKIEDANKCLKFFLCCFGCFVGCFERCIEFLNSHAYIEMAITGSNFCKSAAEGFKIIINNPLRFTLLSGIGKVLIFIGRAFICLVSTCLGYMLLTKVDRWSSKITNAIAPCFVLIILSFVCGTIFLSVYGMASDAMMHCFIYDEEHSKSKGIPAANTPQPLREFIDKHMANITQSENMSLMKA